MRTLLIALASALALSTAVPAFAQYPPTPGTGTFTTIENIEYANVRGLSLQLDLRIPDAGQGTGSAPWPVILYLHSGAWVTGDRTGGPAIRQASRGYAVASIDYRLAPYFTWPAQIEDCKAAVRWLRANAARYQLDPERIGVLGTSSGGHLAVVLGTSGGVDSLEGLALGNAQYSSRVKAVVDMYGPTDLLKMQEQQLNCIPLDANSPALPPSLLMGCAIQDCQEKTETANPINYITRDDPPFLIMHGMADCLVPWLQSQMLFGALQAQDLPAKLYLLPTAGHADKQFDELKYKQIISDFLDKNLRGPIQTTRKRAARK